MAMKINKSEMKKMISDFSLDNLGNDSDISYQKVLNSMLTSYNDEISVQENFENTLNQVKTISYFYLVKSILKAFVNYYNIDVDISKIMYQNKDRFILTFKDLETQIQMGEQTIRKLQAEVDENRRREIRRHANFYHMAKIYAYLLWIGVSSDDIKKIKRTDYDKDKKILTTSKGIFDLSLYPIIHDELENNIDSYSTISDADGFKEYVISASMIEKKVSGSTSSYIIRTRNNELSESTMKKIVTVVSNYVEDPLIISKSGLFYKFYRDQLIININNIIEEAQKFNYRIEPSMARRYHKEWNLYKEQIERYEL